MKPTLCALALAISLSIGGASRAAEISLDSSAGGGWYGWQTLSADAGSLVFLFATASKLNAGALAVSGICLAACAPLIHLAHARPEAAAWSFALRVGPPLLGYAVGAALPHGPVDANGNGGSARTSGLLLGVALSLAISLPVDSIVLARDDRPAFEFVMPHRFHHSSLGLQLTY